MMGAISSTHYMLLSATLFMIGVFGVLTRRNIIIIFMSIELILNAVNINLMAFSLEWRNSVGQVFTLFVIAVAAAEAAVGLALVIALFRHRESLNPDAFTSLKW
jgi:NADH:ubiquinone oxidoreductase subunit K